MRILPMRILPFVITLAVIASTVLFFRPLPSRAEPLVKSGESIAFLGDSITYFGAFMKDTPYFSTENPGGYVRLVESGLAAQGINVTAIPAGWSGNNSKHMLGRVEKDVLSKKPTWMTLSAGVNDVMHRAVELEDYKTNITAILDRAQQAGVKVVILTATQIGLPVTNEANVKLAGYNAFLRETAKARNLPLADVNAAMVTEQASLEKAGIKRALTTDGVHMNIYGDMVMAKGVLAAFGLDERQLSAAQAKWNEIPGIFETTAKIKLSGKQLAALQAYAASLNKSVETIVTELSTNAVNDAVKAAPAKNAAVKTGASSDTASRGETSALNNQLRILTLGDSITAIFRYQASLRESLKAQGVDAEFVGAEGKDPNKHEGHSGWSIGAIEDKAIQYLTDSNANVVLLQIGVNNMNHGLGLKGKEYPPYQDGVQAQGAKKGKTLDELGASWGDKNYGSGYLTARVNGLLDKILTHPNQPFLVVAKIPGIGLGNPLWKAENNDADARIREFNTILETAVKARQAKGQKVEIVDNYALGNRAYGTGPEFTWGTQDQQSGDWVHPRPDAAAWKGMATNFAAGLRRLIKR